jgi:predicted enzyme related to lactoylglutathione lyase
MNRPIHFEIPAEKPERAMKFYEKVFGWKFEKWGGPMEYWVVRTGDDGVPGINGGLIDTARSGAALCEHDGRS